MPWGLNGVSLIYVSLFLLILSCNCQGQYRWNCQWEKNISSLQRGANYFRLSGAANHHWFPPNSLKTTAYPQLSKQISMGVRKMKQLLLISILLTTASVQAAPWGTEPVTLFDNLAPEEIQLEVDSISSYSFGDNEGWTGVTASRRLSPAFWQCFWINDWSHTR